MIKIHEVIKGEGYYSLSFSEGVNLYGAIIIISDDDLIIEFMEFKRNEIVNITVDNNPEEFIKLKEKYLDVILKNVGK
jgi:hypothetical protein